MRVTQNQLTNNAIFNVVFEDKEIAILVKERLLAIELGGNINFEDALYNLIQKGAQVNHEVTRL